MTDTQLTLAAEEFSDPARGPRLPADGDGSTFASTEDLRTIKMWNKDPSAPPRYEYDIRGTPAGDRAQVWEFERMVVPHRRTRRVRQQVKVMHCPEGWYGSSGTRTSAAIASCATVDEYIQRAGGFKEYKAFHEAHPVVWVIDIREPGGERTYHYCDAELPAEYRPAALQEQHEQASEPAWHEKAEDGTETWEWQRLDYPKFKRSTKRQREVVTVSRRPGGWLEDTVPRGSHRCASYSIAREERVAYCEFHGENYELQPVVWYVQVYLKGSDRQIWKGGWWCDAHLPDEFRPGTHQEAEAARRQEKRPVAVTYYATVDTFTTTGQAKAHYWYRIREGRKAGQIAPWPPRRSPFGTLCERDVPEGLAGEERDGWKDRYFAECRAIERAAADRISTQPDEAAALFAAMNSSCCCCGRALSDDYSVAYGIGPECRAGLAPEELTRLAEKTSRVHARQAAGELPEAGVRR